MTKKDQYRLVTVAYIYLNKKRFGSVPATKFLSVDIIVDGNSADERDISGETLENAYDNARKCAAESGAEKVVFGARIA